MTYCTPQRLREELERLAPRVLLFIGHGDAAYPLRPRTLTLALDGAQGYARIDPTTLGDVLGHAKGLELALLMGCRTAALGARVADHGIPVVCWETLLEDAAGRHFTPALLRNVLHHLALGRPLRRLLPTAFKQAQLAVKCVPNPATGTEKYVFDDPAKYRSAPTPQWPGGKIHGRDGSGRASIGVPKLLVKLPYNVVCELKVPDLIAALLGWLRLSPSACQHFSLRLANSGGVARLAKLMLMSEADVNSHPIPDDDKQLLIYWLGQAQTRAADPLGGGLVPSATEGVKLALREYFVMPGAHIDVNSIEVHVLQQPVRLSFTIQLDEEVFFQYRPVEGAVPAYVAPSAQRVRDRLEQQLQECLQVALLSVGELTPRDQA